MAAPARYVPSEQRHRQLQVLLAVGFSVVIIRLFQLQIISRQYYVEEVAAIIGDHSTPVGPQPGAIYARDRQPLAESLLLKTCVANPRLMLEEGESFGVVAEALAPLIGRDEATIRALLDERRDKAYAELAPFLREDAAARIKALDITGVDLVSEWRREYPLGQLACHIVGGRDRYHRPRAGLEHLYASLLDPEPGVVDATHRGGWAGAGAGARPQPGRDLVLTLDLGLQRQVERQLDAMMARERPKWASAVVMDPRTGEVLALGSRPAYDPNAWVEPRRPGQPRSTVTANQMCNVPVTLALEQGSTFKVLLLTNALQVGVVKPETTFHCTGHMNIGGRPITCWGRYGTTGHGDLNMYGMIGQSCNCIAARVALLLGAERYCEFLQRAGIGADPEAGFPAEAFGLLRSAAKVPPRDVATMGFGQNVSCSGLQLTAAVAGIMNNGMMKRPHILGAVLNGNGSVFREGHAGEIRLCSPETSAIMRRMLQYAVQHGTAAPVNLPDFVLGGKTGTAQEWDFENGRHYTDRYMVSFLAVAPINDPRYVIWVACNEPQVGEHGSDVAGPPCRRIAEYALRRMGQAPVPAAAPNNAQ